MLSEFENCTFVELGVKIESFVELALLSSDKRERRSHMMDATMCEMFLCDKLNELDRYSEIDQYLYSLTCDGLTMSPIYQDEESRMRRNMEEKVGGREVLQSKRTETINNGRLTISVEVTVPL